MSELEELQRKYIAQQKALAKIYEKLDTAAYWIQLAKKEYKLNSKTSLTNAKTHVNGVGHDLNSIKNRIMDLLTNERTGQLVVKWI